MPSDEAIVKDQAVSAGRRRWVLVGLNVLGIFAVFILDILTGKEISFSIFYLPPIAYIAWVAGFRWAIGAAALSGVCWHIADFIAGNAYSHPLIPIWNAVMRTLVFITVSLILSKLKGAIEREQAARQVAVEATLAKSDFLATLSHEIRTPLNAMIGAADILSETRLTPDQSEYLAILKSESEQARRLLNDILDYSKIEAHRIELEETTFSLRTLIGTACQSLEPRCREKGLTLEWSVSPSVTDSRLGDPFRLRQVLTNLLSNAVKFTETGSVTVQVEATRAPNISFSVRDTGIGIPSDQQDGLFGRFNQANATVTRRFGGSGLGLNIAKGLVERMGGQIGFTSVESQGTSFFFELPLPISTVQLKAEPVTEANDQPTGRIAQPAHSLRILLVDDYEFNRRIIGRFLKHPLLQIDMAENGRRGLEKVLVGRYDLVLLDMHMPEMDGWATAREIRKWEKEKSANTPLPIIALTASVFKEDEDRCLAAGCSSFLGKPIRKKDLLAEIEKVLQINLSQAMEGSLTAEISEIDPEIEALIPGFLDEVCQRCESLIQAGLNDPASAAEMAHQLVGLGGTYGFGKISELAQQIEHAIAKCELHEVTRLASELNSYAFELKRKYE